MAGSSPTDFMTDSFMPFFRKTKYLLWVLMFFSAASWAEGIWTKSAALTLSESGYALNAEFNLELTPTLEGMLDRGIPLTFVVRVEVQESRWYWFNRSLAKVNQERRIIFNPITRSWRYSIGSLYLNFTSLADALKAISRVQDMPLLPANTLVKGHPYKVDVQMELAVDQLPKPFQIDALSSSDWKLESRPLQWTYTP
jgi:hypothetical protein